MYSITDILKDKNHRPFDYPSKPWVYYQEWNNTIFLHWEVPTSILETMIPKGLQLDTYNHSAYVSLVAFTMEKIRPRYLPAISMVSTFHEINLRTYVNHEGKAGVYFLSIEAEKLLATYIAKALSGLPYEKSKITRTKNSYRALHPKRNFSLHTTYDIGSSLTEKSTLDHWLTERYRLYLDQGHALYYYDIQHKPWEINTIQFNTLDVDYRLEELHLKHPPTLTHYSKGVQVVAWGREKILQT